MKHLAGPRGTHRTPVVESDPGVGAIQGPGVQFDVDVIGLLQPVLETTPTN